MADKQNQFYYKNVMADVIGHEHGITKEQLGDLARQTIPLMGKAGQYTPDRTYDDFTAEIRAKTGVDPAFMV